MEDKEELRGKKFKKIIIICIISIITIIGLFYAFKYFKMKQIENKLKKDGYEEVVKKIYSKNENDIGYTYNLLNNDFSKTMEKSDDNSKELINIIRTNNKIEIVYQYQSMSCQITQEGTYSNNNFDCNITKKRSDCKTKCDIMYDYVKEFEKEIKKYN